MKIIICGSRGIENVTCGDIDEIFHALLWQPTAIVSGCCRGSPDMAGEKWAKTHEVLLYRHPANWKTLGRAAGPIRNQEMVDESDALLAFYDGTSKGTAGIVEMAQAKGIPVKVIERAGSR